MSSATLATLSNGLVTSAMTVYALAMVAFAAEWAFGRRGLVARTSAAVARHDERRQLAAGQAHEASVITLEPPPGAVVTTPAEREQRAERLGRVALSLTVLAFVLHFGGLVTRGFSAGRVPWSNMYEFATSGAFVVMGVFLLLLALREDIRWLGVFVVAPVLLTVGLAVTVLYQDATELQPALRSYWLVIHVVAAVIASGLITVGAVVTGLHLWVARRERLGTAPAYAGSRPLPGSGALDRLAYRLFAFAFPIWTFAVIAGAIWAQNAWNRYWGWDPKETWAFITWVVFAAYLHARATAGWRGRSAAIIALVGFATMLFNFIGVNLWIVGLHSYA